jgi:hypothetical protein
MNCGIECFDSLRSDARMGSQNLALGEVPLAGSRVRCRSKGSLMSKLL